MDRKQKVAIVTGASRGIGAAIAKRLASEEIAVVINYASRKQEAEHIVNDIHSSGGNAFAFQADVSDARAVKHLFDIAEEKFGAVEILVNSAGILPAHLPMLSETDDKTFDDVFAINVKGSFNTMREAAKRLLNGGRIVNFSSSIIGARREGYSVYAASKAAIESFTAVFAKELRGRNITVNAVAPGPVATEMFLTGKSEELVEQFKKLSPLERLGAPEDIASVVAFLVGPDGGWVNGQVLRANGGYI